LRVLAAARDRIDGLGRIGGELAALIRLYRQRVADFNAADDNSQDEDERQYKAANAILYRMQGVPVRSTAEAVMAIDLIFETAGQHAQP
jgi:hypothetical protein